MHTARARVEPICKPLPIGPSTEPIANKTPAKAEERYYAMLDAPAMAA